MSRLLVNLTPGRVLTVTPVGAVQVYISGESPADFLPAARSWGPYLVDRQFVVDGDATAVTSEYTVPLNAYVYPNAGAPADAAQATASINPAGDDNALIFTARDYGAGGNSLQVQYLDPGAASQALAVSVDRQQKITVSLATNGSSVITSTAAQVKAAIEASVAANDLVAVAINTADTGSADDGSGVVTAIALTAFTGGAGTGIGVVAKGGIVVDTTNGKQYRNIGTQAVPAWFSREDLHLYGAGAPVDYTDGDPAATGEGTAYAGAIYSDITNANVYRNDGTRAQPIWVMLGDAA